MRSQIKLSRSIRHVIALCVASLLLSFGQPALSNPEIDALRSELSSIQNELTDATEVSKKYKSGLLNALALMRIEILKINAALVQQKILEMETGAKYKEIILESTKPDTVRSQNILDEIQKIKSKIEIEETHSAQYKDGLVKAMIDSGIATEKITMAMLNIEYMKSKYGIKWVPKIENNNSNDNTSNKTINSDLESKKTTLDTNSGDHISSSDSENLLVPNIINKRFQDVDFNNNIIQRAIWFDIMWNTENLDKPTRAVKGVLKLCDLFGEVLFRVRLTLDDPLQPGTPYFQNGVGFKYNQFMSEHQWVRTTELKNMTFRFEVQDILYKDGAHKSFSSQ